VTEPDPTSIASAVLKFYNEGSLDRFHQNLVEEKKKYSWEGFVKNLLQSTFKD
jgi:hypothetical protein